jgi:hypothetical protein
MDQESKKRVRKQYPLIVRNLIARDICGDLYQKHVINTDEMERVTLLPIYTTADRAAILLSILMTKTEPGVLNTFCDVLRSKGISMYSHIADELQNCDVSSEPDMDEPDSVTNKDQLIKTIQEQSHMLLKAVQENEVLRKENRILKEREALITHLNSNDFTNENLLTFAKLFLFTKPQDTHTTATVHKDGDIGSVLDSVARLAPDCAVACRLFIDIIHYVAVKDSLLKPFSNRAVILRKKVDSMHSDHSVVFDNAIKMMNIHVIDGYQTFSVVADELFQNGESNWGRVVSWCAFTSYLAQGFPDKSKDVLDLYGTYCWFFLDKYLSAWITKADGWGSFLQFLDKLS